MQETDSIVTLNRPKNNRRAVKLKINTLTALLHQTAGSGRGFDVREGNVSAFHHRTGEHLQAELSPWVLLCSCVC